TPPPLRKSGSSPYSGPCKYSERPCECDFGKSKCYFSTDSTLLATGNESNSDNYGVIAVSTAEKRAGGKFRVLETRKFPDKFLIQLPNFYRLEVGRSWVHVEEGTEDEKRNRRDVGDVFFRGEVCMKSFLGGLGLGVTAGVLSGLVGIGGGIIIVPALVYFFKMDQKTAQGTSLAILLPPTGLLAFLVGGVGSTKQLGVATRKH